LFESGRNAIDVAEQAIRTSLRRNLRNKRMPPLRLPVQAVVDREEMLQPFMIDTPITDPTTGKVLEVLRAPVNGSHGSEPSDPAFFCAKIDFRVGLGHVFSSDTVPDCARERERY
jgi:hypothetical protein